MNRLLYTFLFVAGLALMGLASFGLYQNLSPSKQQLEYELGTVVTTKGYVRSFKTKGELEEVEVDTPLFSLQGFKLGKQASLKLHLNNQSLTIEGPSQFQFFLPDPNTKEVFLNFSEFTGITPNQEHLTNIHLVFKGWSIAPFFAASDLEKSSSERTLNLFSSTTSGSETKRPKVSPDALLNETTPKAEKENYLMERISLKRPLIQKCYEHYLDANPMATGKMMVEFAIHNSGRISAVKIKDSSFFQDTQFKRCLHEVFSRIKVKPFSGQTYFVQYPVEFE